jgi:uncharacterized protein (DUF58 family)
VRSRRPARILQKFRAAFRRRIRYRITAGGVLYFFAVFLVGTASFLTANNLLFLLFSALLAILLVSGFVSRLMLSGLELELLLPEHVWAGTAAPARIRLRNLKRITPSFSLELAGQRSAESGPPPILTAPVYFPVIPGRATLEAAVDVTFPHRGRHKENVFLIGTRFPFGFLRKTTTLALQRETLVYPAPEPFPGAEAIAGYAGSADQEAAMRGPGRDFYRIRPYESGDSARHIDWKSTAHTGLMHIREFSRDHHGIVEIYLDRRTAAGKTSEFETTVGRCAWLVSRLGSGDSRSRRASLLFQSQGFTHLAAGEADFYVILKYLALVEPLIAVTSAVTSDPGSESHLQVAGVRIVFSARPEDFQSTGWAGAFFVDPAQTLQEME